MATPIISGRSFSSGVLGDFLENQVLLIKTAWGGKSLYRDFRPPSSGGTTGPYYRRHDELVLECPEDELSRTAALVQQVMADAYQLRVPLQTEARFGHNWGQMNPVSQAKS